MSVNMEYATDILYQGTASIETPSLVNVAGGTFAEDGGNIVFDDANTGAINVDASTIGGPYDVVYTYMTCTDTFQIYIAAAGCDASFSYASNTFTQLETASGNITVPSAPDQFGQVTNNAGIANNGLSGAFDPKHFTPAGTPHLYIYQPQEGATVLLT